MATLSRPLTILRSTALVVAAVALTVMPISAQTRGSGPIQEAQQLDLDGAFTQARALYQSVLDTASDPAAKAAVHRRMAVSYGFAGDCANAVRYHEMVIAYWVTQETAEPQNAFYQEGEMANESARLCIDSGDLNTAECMYRRGYELGLKEPEPRTHPKSLWDFRLAHALGRIAAQRGDKAAAQEQVAAARRALDSDPAMVEQQERFFPYLAGYVALFTGDLETAQVLFTSMLELRGNQNDPFMHCLMGMTYERQGRMEEANEWYQKAYDMARAHNPPAAFARRFARQKIGRAHV